MSTLIVLHVKVLSLQTLSDDVISSLEICLLFKLDEQSGVIDIPARQFWEPPTVLVYHRKVWGCNVRVVSELRNVAPMASIADFLHNSRVEHDLKG